MTQTQQNRRLRENAAAATVLGVTIFFLCMDDVKALAVQAASLSLRTVRNNGDSLALVASGASSLARRMSSTARRNVVPFAPLGLRLPSSTSLNMAWSMPVAPNLSSIRSGGGLGAFGSWYEERDPRAGPPIYDDDGQDYSFSSPADDWPAMDGADKVRDDSRGGDAGPRPLRAIRRAAGWAIGGLPHLVAGSF
eukprot:CAMPEP_0183296960 /NCGR_PEP_ID=MMETSP0160_2-20130417/4358_1 /TAXON_ID=2839 ORGANISM="Odontella Sinensis, Strain Grunow 1884" /NCGR_SAMPLE_ID=MMETSP0160_2 /ASSEMBLY_ACC=CAM_ASM_000250 /LENGTH=193 /DNA_ID=CAMNT_0025458671 /DNA_START=113 /DNA_END=694 /DNA_ORIENTATION=-